MQRLTSGVFFLPSSYITSIRYIIITNRHDITRRPPNPQGGISKNMDLKILLCWMFYLLYESCKSLIAEGKKDDLYLSLLALIERGLPDLSENIIWWNKGWDLSFKMLWILLVESFLRICSKFSKLKLHIFDDLFIILLILSLSWALVFPPQQIMQNLKTLSSTDE